MYDDDVFHRQWTLSEAELLELLWRCYGGENPDVAVLELHALHSPARGGSRPAFARRTHRTTRHIKRDGTYQRG